MIPLRDNIPSRTTPIVNYLMIAACAWVFMQQLNEQPGQPSLVEQYGMIPQRVRTPDKPIVLTDRRVEQTRLGPQVRVTQRQAADSAVPEKLTLLTCIFLHGGWMHFIGNMWFLMIFGDNVEDRLGHVGYLLFYLGCGAAASAAHMAAGPESTMPTIGASGAIAGVMGAYLVLYPRAKVLTLVPIFIFFQILVLPAPLFLGVWFVIQFFQGTFAITSTQASGVAWWAHIGGFLTGAIVATLLRSTRAVRPSVQATRPGTDRIGGYRVYPRRNRRG